MVGPLLDSRKYDERLVSLAAGNLLVSSLQRGETALERKVGGQVDVRN